MKTVASNCLPRNSFSARSVIVSVLLTVTGCATINRAEIYEGKEIVSTYQISITRKAVIAASPEVVFNFVTAEDVLPKVLTGYGPLPAVTKTSGNTGPWTTVGSARLVHLADESTVREQLTRYAPSTYFAYRVWEFGNPIIRTLANEAKGEWTFSRVPEGTSIAWTYTFSAKNSLAALPLSGIMKLLWRGYMDVCLENTMRLLKPTQ
jgi:Polyketide cyclase / dehydrase and lipid transport